MDFPFAGKSIYVGTASDNNSVDNYKINKNSSNNKPRISAEIPSSDIASVNGSDNNSLIRGRSYVRTSRLSSLRRPRLFEESLGFKQANNILNDGLNSQGSTQANNQQLPRLNRLVTTEHSTIANGFTSNVLLPKIETSPRHGPPTGVGVDEQVSSQKGRTNNGYAIQRLSNGRIRRQQVQQQQQSTTMSSMTGMNDHKSTHTPPPSQLSTLSSSTDMMNNGGYTETMNTIAPQFVHETIGKSAVTSLKGLKPGRPNWINQDSYFLHSTVTIGEMHCVLDGHGEHGHYVSQKCRQLLPQYVINSNNDLKKAFATMQQQLSDTKEFDAKCSGATCVMTILKDNHLIVAHCGDSRAVLGRRNVVGGYNAVVLTEDHKPDRPDEHRRILNAGGYVGSRQLMMGFTGAAAMGPVRVWYRNGSDTLGLAMSRSLGDVVVHTCGVSAEPEINEYVLDIQNKDEFIILATDGLWDVIDSTQAVRLVGSMIHRHMVHESNNISNNNNTNNLMMTSSDDHMKSNTSTPNSNNIHNWNVQEVSHQLVMHARKRWEAMSMMIDDITVLIVNLRATSPPTSIS